VKDFKVFPIKWCNLYENFQAILALKVGALRQFLGEELEARDSDPSYLCSIHAHLKGPGLPSELVVD